MTQTQRALSLASASLQRWLKKRITTLMVIRILSAVILLALGIVVLIGTFLFAYAVIWVGYNMGVSSISELLFGKRLHLSHNLLLVICSSFICLLFFENAFVERDYWSQYSVGRSQWSDLWIAGLLGSLASLLVNADTSAKIISDLLLIGPRLIEGAFRSIRSMLRLGRINIAVCAYSIEVLVKRNTPVSLTELQTGLSAQTAFSQLSELGTVLLVRKEPLKVVLDPDLREQLRSLFGVVAAGTSNEAADERPVMVNSTVRPLYELLGISPAASLDEIRRAYRKSMKQWHPDVFNGNSEAAAQAAEEKAKQIIAAYETLVAAQKSKMPPARQN
jgi:hypothetical protein